MVVETKSAFAQRCLRNRSSRIRRRSRESVGDNFIRFGKPESRGKEIDMDSDFGLWPASHVRTFIELMEAEVDRNSLKSAKFDARQWSQLLNLLNEKCNRSYNPKQIKEKYGRLKLQWRAFHDLKNQSGMGWDEDTQAVTCDPLVWKSYVQAHPKASEFKSKGLPNYDVLTKIFQDSTAEGLLSRASSQRVYDLDEEHRVMYEFAHPAPSNAPHVNLDDDDEYEPMHTGSGSRKRRSSGGSSGRATKSSRMDVAVSANAEKSIAKSEYYRKKVGMVDRSAADNQYSIENAMHVLIGIDGLNHVMIDFALEKITNDPNWRKTFMVMKPEWRLGWLDRLSSK